MLPVVPYPQRVVDGGRTVTLPATISDEMYPHASASMREYARRTHGIELTVAKDAAIRFAYSVVLPDEVYTLKIDESGALITASSCPGAQNAVATLLQLMRREGDGFTAPACTIFDYPECSWRGISVDLARGWHDIGVLYEYVDLCYFFKIKSLQLHFTDDQSFTLPSSVLPKLSTPGRHYTVEELKGLIAYADSRDVKLIPEIDAPGHCTPFIEQYPEIFGRDGVIHHTEKSIKALEALYAELCELFSSSDYVHIGGDEAAVENWLKCPSTLDTYRAAGMNVDAMEPAQLKQIIYAIFVARMCNAVTACGKTPVVWEGFGPMFNHLIPRNVVVMSWENYYQTTPDLLKAGFRVVNCSWRPMYVVAPAALRPIREVYDWDVYSWTPVHPHSPYIESGLKVEPTLQIEGGQLLAWGDFIMKKFKNVEIGVRYEQERVEERTPMLSENTWHRTKVSDYDEVMGRYRTVYDLYRTLKETK